MTSDVTQAPARPAWATELNDQEWLFVAAYLDSLKRHASRARRRASTKWLDFDVNGRQTDLYGRSFNSTGQITHLPWLHSDKAVGPCRYDAVCPFLQGGNEP